MEALERFRRLEEDQRNSRNISHSLERESTRDKSSDSGKVLVTYHILMLQREGKEPLDKYPIFGNIVGSSQNQNYVGTTNVSWQPMKPFNLGCNPSDCIGKDQFLN